MKWKAALVSQLWLISSFLVLGVMLVNTSHVLLTYKLDYTELCSNISIYEKGTEHKIDIDIDLTFTTYGTSLLFNLILAKSALTSSILCDTKIWNNCSYIGTFIACF
jgi:hypothetical protein